MVYNGEYRKKEREHELSFLNEAYFGRTANIEKMIKQIHVIREKAGVGSIPGNFNIIKYNLNINTFPEVIEFNRLLEKEFGFKTASLQIIQNAEANAFAIPVGISADSYTLKSPKEMLESTKSGFRYKKEAGYALMIFITTGVFLNEDITDEEILAILLHEIGHNFSSAISNELGGLALTKTMLRYLISIKDILLSKKFINILTLASTENWFKNLVNTIDTHTKNIKILRFSRTIIDAVFIALDVRKTIMIDVATIKSLNPINSLIQALRKTSKWPTQITNVILGGVEDEKLADAFPAMYGLGAEQASALSKLNESNRSIIGDILFNYPIIGHITNIIHFPIIFMGSLFDPHPNLNQRFRLEIEYLENELNNNNIDPKMKAEIKRQLVQIKKDFKEYCDIDTLKEKNDPHIVQRMYEEWLHRAFKGGFKDNIWKNDNLFAKVDSARNRSDIDNSKNK